MATTTKPQRSALHALYLRNNDGSDSYRSFRRRARLCFGVLGLTWCGMFIGIEIDGYRHS